MIGWSYMVPNDAELNNDRVELILVPKCRIKSGGVDIDVELNNDRVELILVPNDVESKLM